jgi:maltose/moltooligosaccharide transporter
MIPNNVRYAFYAGAFFFLLAILRTVMTTSEYPPEVQRQFSGEEAEEQKGGLGSIVGDIANMPSTMRKLGLVQFFSWFGLFSMWL